ncbi:MAG: AAA family ATPase [Thermoproteaceae archaeon]|jgi:dephospho-CoA kinase|nr:AAA family ATPase [Thermoproteaceae archaeon]
MPRVIAVAGLPGSGKTTVAKILERYGYAYYCLGDIVRERAQELGVPPDKAAVLSRLREGRRALAAALLKRVGSSERIVIDGVRSPEELEALEEALGSVTLVYVVASRRTRYQRLAGRGRGDDPASLSQFLMRDLRELKFGLADLLARADYVVLNEGKSLEELEAEVRALARRLDEPART